MFCPNCALQNSDDAGFCRSCGTNLAVVRKALTTQSAESGYDELTPTTGGRHLRDRSTGEPSLEKGITKIFIGLAFLLVSVSVMLYAPGGRIWWFWMLIPAFGSFGKGVAQLMEFNRLHPKNATALPPVSIRQFPERDASNVLTPPASVTEGTTRTLNMPRDRDQQ
jgi:hypothetical protein